MPKCKGFALVTLSDPAHIQSLLTQWPWDRLTGSAATSTPNNEEAESEVHREARKIRFRAISKSRWNELNEEYLAYRQSLLEEIQANEEEDYIEDWDEHKTRKRRLGSPLGSEYTEKEKVEGAEGNDRQSGVPVTTLASPYPHNCLLFVRNIHPETNKTTLKTLFAGALMTADGAVQVSGVDYVDFNQGMDSVSRF